jgi:predicted transposase/invertase (TIGR01784 family)
MPEALTNPHDRFFKELFSRQEAAQDFLQNYLPLDIANLLDLASLTISKDSFIDPELQEHFSDLLYRVALHSGSETYIYLLFEHKSYPEPFIALQLLRYMVRIWDQSLKQRQALLPILPLVIYHGQATWKVALDFTALFELPPPLQPFVPTYRYWLCDLSRYSDEAIKGEVTLQVGLLLLKYILRDDLRQHLGQILGLIWELAEQDTGLEYLKTILRYLSGGTDKLTAIELEQIVTAAFSEGEGLMPTIAEQWVEQGRTEGLKQGLEQGLEQGLRKGREEGREAALALLRRFLAFRFSVPLNQFDDEFQSLDLAAVTQLSDAAFGVETLAEFKVALAKLKADKEEQKL